MREALPNALIVADHFHLVALASQALTVRRRVTWDTVRDRHHQQRAGTPTARTAEPAGR